MGRNSPRQETIEQIYDSFRRVMGLMHGRMRTGVTGHGVTLPQMILLRILVHKKRATPKELADILCVTPGNITGLVANLEKTGFITRTRDTKDRRVVHLKPTLKARRGVEAVNQHALKSLETAFDGWSMDDMKELKRLLARLEKSEAGRRASSRRR
jgi:DNA-binding MarR family transcriptional regulator